ncbi:MAG TPA: hypothetical protein VGK44_01835 [Casimicrobiaceae bacterium]|jgi:hypothetical protein
MDARSIFVFLVAFTVAESVLACSRIDYAEAKDWSPDELERQYCAAVGEMQRSSAAGKAAPTPQAGLAIMRSADGCYEQAKMYERIFKNIHKLNVPTCK